MATMTPKAVLQKVLSFLGSLIAPATPRGRVRRATFLVLALFVFAGSIADARHWDRAADWVNGATGLRIPHFWSVGYRLGLDLQGGTHLVYVADVAGIDDSERAEAISGVRDVIERRVNAFGVSEPLVQTNKSGEDWRVIVDLAGVKDISEAIRLIGETPILEFKEFGESVPVRDLTAEEKADMEQHNAAARTKAQEALGKARTGGDFAALATEYSDDEATKGNGGDLGFVGPTSGDPAVYAAVKDKPVGAVLPTLVDGDAGLRVVKIEEMRDGPKEMMASHILVCWTGATSCGAARTKEEALARAQELISKASAENFAQLAKENSDDPGSGPNGGDLGWFGAGAMVKEFEDGTAALAKGAITASPVESQFGYHVIRKTDERSQPEYRLRHILARTKAAADYLPPVDPWKTTELSGKHLKRSTLQFDPQTNAPQVGIEFNDEGKEFFRAITERNIGKPVAIYLDGEAISIPTVNETIHDGSAVITGQFTIQEAKLLVRRLNAGALPVPIRLESQQSVGATLGQESLTLSLQAGMIGFAIVALFMLLYYRLSGAIAIVALLLYSVINLALYKLIPVTLTLSGIAGFILSVGMAVDANVLIFERTKEELLRGRTLGSSIDEGFRRAWLSIRDSNFTTLISCAILFYTSTSLIKGFALTLGLGVIVSMFSAITVSRTLLKLVSGWPIFANPNWYLAAHHRIAAPADGDAAKS
jgi:protein-export membrane protein SecD